MTVYCCFELHINLWYADYTDEEVIRRFPNLYRSVLDVFERNNSSRCAFDLDSSRTIPFLERAAPGVISRLRAGVDRRQFEILLDTWSLTLPPLLTEEEFLFQYQLALECQRKVFGEKGLSKGYFCQENSYSPTLLPLLKKVGIEFLCTPFTTLLASYEKINVDKDRYVLLEGPEGAVIPAAIVTFTTGWNTTLQEALQLSKKLSPNEDVFFFVLFDAEMVEPKKLEAVIRGIMNEKSMAFALPSEFIESHKPTRKLKTTWETTTVGDFGLWVRDASDHYLLTLNEQARHTIETAKFWIDKAREAGLEVSQEHNELNQAQLYQLQAFNSDKMGWNPCWEKRKIAEAEYISAMEKANIAKTMASEKCSRKAILSDSPRTP